MMLFNTLFLTLVAILSTNIVGGLAAAITPSAELTPREDIRVIKSHPETGSALRPTIESCKRLLGRLQSQPNEAVPELPGPRSFFRVCESECCAGFKRGSITAGEVRFAALVPISESVIAQMNFDGIYTGGKVENYPIVGDKRTTACLDYLGGPVGC